MKNTHKNVTLALTVLIGIFLACGAGETNTSTSSPSSSGSPSAGPRICTADSERKARDLVDSFDIQFAEYREAPVYVNRNLVWQAVWAQANVPRKQTLVQLLAVYNNCIHYPQRGWAKKERYYVELRDAYTDEKIASISAWSGFKIH